MRVPVFKSLIEIKEMLCGGLISCAAFLLVTSQPVHAQNTPASEQGSEETVAPEGSVGGLGDVNLFPRRVVIQNRQRIATVGLYNKVPTLGEYEIKIDDMMMTSDGQLVNFDQIEDEAAKAKVQTASNMLRWSPRRVALAGNEAQTVRIMARPPADLPDGEYRSHFFAIAVPPVEDGGLSIDQAITGETGAQSIGISIRPRFGIAIPVIVRVGETTLQTSMSDIAMLTLPDGSRAVGITINRSGTRSAYGDITITAPGADGPIAVAKGVGAYPEVDSRKVVVPIDAETEPQFLAPGTRYTITYTDDDFEPGAKLAEQDFVVP